MRALLIFAVAMCGTLTAAQHSSKLTVSSPLQQYVTTLGCLLLLLAAAASVARRFRVSLNAARQAQVELKEVRVVTDALQIRPPIPTTPFTRAEVAQHNTKSDCWIVVHNLVLDVTEYMPLHPGGERTISIYAGGDATECYDTEHYPDTIELYAPEVIIGMVAD